jgi:hypothetical protein
MERDALLERIRIERARLDEALSKLTDEQLLERDDGAWTRKDHLAHLATWQRVALARVVGTEPGDIADVVRGEYTEDDIDPINERFFEAARDTPIEDVTLDFSGSYDAICEAVARLSDDDLAREWLAGHPERGTFAQTIEANTSEHYPEHLFAFEAPAGR